MTTFEPGRYPVKAPDNPGDYLKEPSAISEASVQAGAHQESSGMWSFVQYLFKPAPSTTTIVLEAKQNLEGDTGPTYIGSDDGSSDDGSNRGDLESVRAKDDEIRPSDAVIKTVEVVDSAGCTPIDFSFFPSIFSREASQTRAQKTAIIKALNETHSTLQTGLDKAFPVYELVKKLNEHIHLGSHFEYDYQLRTYRADLLALISALEKQGIVKALGLNKDSFLALKKLCESKNVNPIALLDSLELFQADFLVYQEKYEKTKAFLEDFKKHAQTLNGIAQNKKALNEFLAATREDIFTLQALFKLDPNVFCLERNEQIDLDNQTRFLAKCVLDLDPSVGKKVKALKMLLKKSIKPRIDGFLNQINHLKEWQKTLDPTNRKSIKQLVKALKTFAKNSNSQLYANKTLEHLETVLNTQIDSETNAKALEEAKKALAEYLFLASELIAHFNEQTSQATLLRHAFKTGDVTSLLEASHLPFLSAEKLTEKSVSTIGHSVAEKFKLNGFFSFFQNYKLKKILGASHESSSFVHEMHKIFMSASHKVLEINATLKNWSKSTDLESNPSLNNPYETKVFKREGYENELVQKWSKYFLKYKKCIHNTFERLNLDKIHIQDTEGRLLKFKYLSGFNTKLHDIYLKVSRNDESSNYDLELKLALICEELMTRIPKAEFKEIEKEQEHKTVLEKNIVQKVLPLFTNDITSYVTDHMEAQHSLMNVLEDTSISMPNSGLGVELDHYCIHLQGTKVTVSHTCALAQCNEDKETTALYERNHTRTTYLTDKQLVAAEACSIKKYLQINKNGELSNKI